MTSPPAHKDFQDPETPAGPWPVPPPAAPQPLLTGRETLAELREMILLRTLSYFTSRNHPEGPFQLLSRLTYTSMANIVNHLPYANCVDLFAMEQACRARSNPAPPSSDASAPPPDLPP